MSDKETEIIKGTAYWAHVHSVSKESDKFQINIGNLDKPMIKILEDRGVSIRDREDEQGKFITAKSTYAPKVIDSQKQQLASSVLIGNGSKVNVKVSFYDWKYKGKSGIGCGLQAVQVVELVEFKSASLDDFDKVDGYTGSPEDADFDEVVVDEDVEY